MEDLFKAYHLCPAFPLLVYALEQNHVQWNQKDLLDALGPPRAASVWMLRQSFN